MRRVDPADWEDAEDSLNAHRTVRGEYEEQKSLEARSREKRVRNAKKVAQRAVTHISETASIISERSRIGTMEEGLRSALRKKAVSRVSLRGSLQIAAFVSFWQFIFALISLAGFILHFMVIQFKEESWVGKILGFFVDFEKFVPFIYIGYGFWAVATLIGVGSFIGFILFFNIIGMKIADSPLSLLLLAFSFGCVILPVSNLAPTLLFWIIYLNARSLSRKA